MKYLLLIIVTLLTSCITSRQIINQAKELTPGIIKKEIRTGMFQAEVIEAIGSPNIITRDSQGKEVWVYDKISAEAEFSSSTQYGTILLLGFIREKKEVVTTQKTLTVIIRFDDKGSVESFSYHYTKF